MKHKLLRYSFIFFFLLLPMLSFAQMFSVDNKVERRSNPFTPYVRGGVQIIDFNFTGDITSIQGNKSLAFTGLAAHAKFESGGFDLGVTLGNDITGLSDRNFFDLSLNFSNAFYFIRRPQFGLGVPLMIGTNVTNVRSDAFTDEFSQTNLSAGAGAITRFIVPQRLDISAQLVPKFGFSTASGGFIGGNVFSLRGKARINLYNLIFNKNISLGYDYIYDSFNIDGEEYDYDFTGHTLTLGISL